MTNLFDLLNCLGSEDDSSETTSSDSEKIDESTSHGIGDSAGTDPGTGAGQRDTPGEQAHDPEEGKQSKAKKEKRGTDGSNGYEFVSYVAAHPGEAKTDPDGLNQERRMRLEAKAIELILAREPDWQQTLPNNPGYDLYKVGEDDQPPIRWCEVKAMKGSLQDRPVGLSRTQFSCARKNGESYWLYVVEHADDDREARIVRIQDPAGRARTFTFDRGWLDIST